MRKLVVPFVVLAALQAAPAHAYLGPGVGAGTIAVVLGILTSVFLAFVGILWYPIKRLLKGRKAATRGSTPPGRDAQGPGTGGSSAGDPGAAGRRSPPDDPS